MNLTLYEQRLQRTQKEALRQLQDLQAKRIAARQTALDETVALHNLHKMKGEHSEAMPDDLTHQFVFSTAEIEPELSRRILHESPRPNAGIDESPLEQAA